jgi:hypothetical protein
METATLVDPFDGERSITADVGFNEGALKMVAYGYTEATRCLAFRVKFYEGIGAPAAARLIRDYNDFDGEVVALALEKLVGRVEKIEVGRAGSPLIMVTVGGGHHNPPLSQKDVLDALVTASPDELWPEDEDDTTIVRAWWD